MTNTMPSRRGRPPRTDAEWAREIQRRLEVLESATTVRIGEWVLSIKDGNLIASTASGTQVVLAESKTTGGVARTALQGRGESAGTAPSPTSRSL